MKTINAKNPRQVAFQAAFNADTTAARAVVLAFEDVMVGYYTDDSRNPINIQFALNVMASRPKLQRAAKSLVGTLGDFKITVNLDDTPADKSYIIYNVTNLKDENLSKADKAAKIAAYQVKLGEFQAKEYTSLIEWSKPQANPKDPVAFAVDKAGELVAKSFDKQIEAALAASANVAELKEALLAKLNAAFSQSNLTNIQDSIDDKARKAEQRREEAEIKAARKARNEAADAESEEAAEPVAETAEA